MGKLANCQALVTLTLADQRVFAPLGMRLFLPKGWMDDAERCHLAGVPEHLQVYKSKGELALEELDRVRAQGVTFRVVLADAGYGVSQEFRHALTTRGLTWAVGVVGHQKVFGEHVAVRDPPPKAKGKGRPNKHPVPSEQASPVRNVLHALPLHHWHTVKGGKKRRGGTQIVRDIKARWSCETLHEQAKEELGLDHFEGRSWRGLTHHVALVMLTMLLLQTVRGAPPSALRRMTKSC